MFFYEIVLCLAGNFTPFFVGNSRSPEINGFFFRSQAFEGTLRKDRDSSAEKETLKNERGKEKGRGQASEREETQPASATPRNKPSPASHVYFPKKSLGQHKNFVEICDSQEARSAAPVRI